LQRAPFRNNVRLFLVLALLMLSSSLLLARDREFYVSLRGNDSNVGTLKHPFRTLEGARDAVRTLRHGDKPSVPVTVYLRQGTYTLSRPLSFSSEDGGSAACPVTYRAYPKEQPVISGGKIIKGWKESRRNGKRVWSVSLPEVKSGQMSFHQIWVDGKRSARARHPNKGYLKIRAVPGVTEKTTWMDGSTCFQYSASDVPASWSFADAEVIVLNRWIESRLPVSSNDSASYLLRFTKRAPFTLEKDDYYYIENVSQALDVPGEWCLDRTAGVLWYLPQSSETLERTEVIIPVLQQLLLLNGEPESGKFVEYVNFAGLTFSYSEWYLPDTLNASLHGGIPDGGFVQAAHPVPGAVAGRGARNVTFDSCVISHVGTYAFELTRGCQNNRLVRSRFWDLGGGGVKIGETVIRPDPADQTRHNDVVDCEIGHGGLLYHSAVGIWIAHSADNRIIHNEIHDLYYSGLSIGWTWGYGPSVAKGNIIELNNVHHIGVLSNGDGPILSDMGGIYTLGTQPGTVIRKNIFHDIAAVRYGGWGIYFDEGSTDILAENNLVYRTTHGGFHQHYGKNNIVRNNIFAFGRDQQLQRTRAEDHLSFTFEHNIVYWNEGKLLAGNFGGSNFRMENNIYWREGGKKIQFDTLTFVQWQARGLDLYSTIADPGFKYPAKGDFSLNPGSGASKAGFRPLPLKAVFSELPEPKPVGRHRLLYNMDGTDLFFYHDTVSPAELCGRVDEVADAGVTTYLFSPNPGQNMGYPSTVCAMFRYTPPDSTKGPVRLTRSDSVWARIGGNFAHLVKRGYDPTGVIVDRARLRGLEAFVTFRMNELHDVDFPGSPLLSEFWKRHPEYRVGGYEGWGAMALNYAEPEVRDYYFALLSEVCNRYDIDGLEMDFMRFPYYFPRDTVKMREHADIMTAFVRRVRAMTEARGKERGRPLLLTARVPSTLKGCAYVGLDPAAWTREQLIDFLTVGPFLSTEVDIPVRDIKAACPGIPVYTSIEYTLGDRPMTREGTRAAAATLFAAGADGIYSFNHFCQRESGPEDFGVFAEIRLPEALDRKAKLYAAGAARYPVPNVSMTSQLPVTITPDRPGEITIQSAETSRPRTVTIRIESDSTLNAELLHLTLNGKALRPLARGTTGLFPAHYWRGGPIPADRCVEFAADPSLLDGKNRISVTSNREVRISWAYLATQY
jgi:hypothetical protein